ncbi:unnamed protein product [Miscanthus lutarioriparius]|uniref:Uncharacterized protein n=1 Tax=Miscanthus lutarioriparius TaxID=422564 RepID=A0A811NFH2_9POAL|nr:unnamed protein product [Miscanthus lutarioriparius]
MGAVVTAVIAIVAVVLGWITIEMACKPCLETGRRAMDRALDPNYDPDSPTNANATTGGAALHRAAPRRPLSLHRATRQGHLNLISQRRCSSRLASPSPLAL